MAVPDKQMGREDLASFLNQQFPKSNEVNNLLEQITASKNAMEKAIGEEIPSFYGTVSKYISKYTVNGISDWINSNGQVNVAQVNRAAQTAKKVYEIQKKEAEQEVENNKKKEQVIEEVEATEKEDKKVDLENITTDKFIDIAKNIEDYWDSMSKEEQQVFVEASDKLAGTGEAFKLIQQAVFDPSVLSDPKVMETIKSGISPKLYNKIIKDGTLDQVQAKNLILQKVRVLGELTSIGRMEPLTTERIQGVLKEFELDGEEYAGLIDVKHVLTLTDEQLDKLCQDMKNRMTQLKELQNQEQTRENTQIPSLEVKGISQEEVLQSREVGDSIDNVEMMLDDLFAEVIDFAEMEEMGMPTLEGEGYVTFFEPSAQELEFQQMQDEQGIDELGGDQMQSDYELGDDGVLGCETEQMDIDGKPAQSRMEAELGDSLEPEEPARVGAPAGFNIVSQLQNAAKEEPNDYTKEEAYQSPTLEDDEKGGILGFFAKIKSFVQDKFTKKPEQKRLNPSSEQRTDENGWTTVTFDGGGEMPGLGIRGTVKRALENVSEFIGNGMAKNKSSSEPLNTPYVIPSNTQSKAREISKDKTNQWVVDRKDLAPLEHSTQDKDELQIDEGIR